MAVGRGLLKAAIGVVALAVLGVLFVRSARSVGSEPYAVRREHLAGWTLVADGDSNGSDVVLAMRPPREFVSSLFRDVFARSGESMNQPVPAEMPLLLRRELGGADGSNLTTEALLTLARRSGLETAVPKPACMAHRRISAPGITRQMYFVVFDVPAFNEFRYKVADVVPAGSAYDPAALSPAVIVAASDARFSDWQPLRANPDADCVAPIIFNALSAP